jgi:hypothetical protein
MPNLDDIVWEAITFRDTTVIPGALSYNKAYLKYDEGANLVSANLDIKNPNNKQDFEHMPPEKLVEDILKKEQRIIEIMTEIRQVLDQEPKG